MKLSAYNHAFELPDGTYVLANLLRQSFLELDAAGRSAFAAIATGAIPPAGDLVEALSEKGMLVADDGDERRFMHDIYAKRRHASDVLGLTIAPTIDCNLACIYCYENKSKGRMSDAVAQEIRAYVERMLPGRRHLHIIWYGGEPLMCKEHVYALSRFFRDFAEACGCSYGAEMTTNALLLDADAIRTMAEIGGWRNIQITLDGMKSDHDKRRPARGGRGSFERVYANLVQIAGALPVSLRMNVDAANVDGCLTLLRQLADDVDPKTIHVYAAPTHFFGKGCRDIADSGAMRIFNNAEFADVGARFTEEARALGFRTNNELTKRPVAQCQAVSSHSIIVEPDGGLQRCWTEVGDATKRIGHIAADVDMTQENVLRWLRFDPTKTDPCASCDVLPTCFGGCPQRHLDGRPAEMICAGIRFRTKATLKSDYIAKFRPDLAPPRAAATATRGCSSCGGTAAAAV